METILTRQKGGGSIALAPMRKRGGSLPTNGTAFG
jgi:hypothetical protein